MFKRGQGAYKKMLFVTSQTAVTVQTNTLFHNYEIVRSGRITRLSVSETRYMIYFVAFFSRSCSARLLVARPAIADATTEPVAPLAGRIGRTVAVHTPLALSGRAYCEGDTGGFGGGAVGRRWIYEPLDSCGRSVGARVE